MNKGGKRGTRRSTFLPVSTLRLSSFSLFFSRFRLFRFSLSFLRCSLSSCFELRSLLRSRDLFLRFRERCSSSEEDELEDEDESTERERERERRDGIPCFKIAAKNASRVLRV